jgi:hypothetical protein
MSEENILGNAPAAIEHTEQTIAPEAAPAVETHNESNFDFTKLVTSEGGLVENWRDALPENIRHEKCLDSIKTFSTLAQSFVHGQKAMGAKRLAIPGETSTPEEWSDFYKALGRPDAEGDYKLDGVELPEGIVLDDGQVAAFRKFAFEHGMSQKTFEAALAFDIQRTQAAYQSQLDAHNAEYNETLNKLKTEFGGNLESVVAQCNKAMETFGLTEVMRDKGLLNNYTMIKALAGIGERIGESKLKGDSGVPSGMDPAGRLAEIRNNPDDPYYQKEHPAHKARVAEVTGLLAAMAKAQG